MPTIVAILALTVGLPACLLRVWRIWWTSICFGCGLERSACVCPADKHTMRPRR